MKVLQAGLNQQAPVLIYDKTKPYLAGRVFSKSIMGSTVYGPPLTGFVNTQVDAALAPTECDLTPNGRLFILTTITAGVASVLLYDFDLTGQSSPAYVGKLQIRVPNAASTTHTARGFRVYDGANNAAVTGWQIYIGTVGTVLINGGLFIANSINKSDFVPTSPATIEMAIASNAKAVYMVQDPGTIGVNNTLTAMQGIGLDRATRRIYFNNNALATTQIAVVDPSATPNLVLQTTTAPTVNASPTFTLTGHGYNANDPVVITANAPTGFTASTASAAQTVYFVRNPTANTFELSATSGGASINAGSVTASTVFTRAFGQSVSQWLNIRTGTITGLSGTILLTDSHKIVTPSQTLDPAIPAAVNGQTCLFLPTSTNFHLFKVSDITNGATSIPSMVAVNNQGTGTDYTGITTGIAGYSETLGRVFYTSNTAQFYMKRWLSGVIDKSFGGINTTYLENPSLSPYTFAGVTILDISIQNGWLAGVLSTAGQRGVIFSDGRSDSSFGYSYVTSPVIDSSDIQAAAFLATVEKLFDLTSTMVFSYKSKATFADTAFDDPTTGWTTINTADDLSSVAFNNFTQFRIDFDIIDGSVNTPAQINEIYLSYNGKNELSSHWEGSVDNTTQNGASPAKTAFRMTSAYTTVVPTLYFRAYDDSGNLVVSANTSANPSFFEYSTNNGTSWSPLGTIPNTAFTTEVRYNWASPPGVRVTCSLRES